MGERKRETADSEKAEILRTESELFRRPVCNFFFIKETKEKMLPVIVRSSQHTPL
jgi:hypothetical protein